jgi:hypothetical protein
MIDSVWNGMWLDYTRAILSILYLEYFMPFAPTMPTEDAAA